MTRRIGILGSTGSIGCQTLDVVRRFPEEFNVVGLSTHTSTDQLQSQVEEFSPQQVAITETNARDRAASELPVEYVTDDLVDLVDTDLDLLVLAVVGAAGVRPCLKALDRDMIVALANKEVLVVAGELIKEREQNSDGQLIPVDSEHSALFQALRGETREQVKNVIITASGGPFREWDQEDIQQVTREQALDHPNWDMGPKITIDSATMMNKGLEIIEACYLFDLEPEQVDALVHPQSAIHGFIEFQDHSMIAQCAMPDMRLPIQFALFYPERRKAVIDPLPIDQPFSWDFEPVDTERFPAFRLARESLERGGSYPAVLNAANEEAVASFLQKMISFPDIPRLVEETLSAHTDNGIHDIEELLERDRWARRYVREKIS